MSLIPWGLILKGLAILAVMAAVYWAWEHFIADPYIAKGVAQEKVHTDAQTNRAVKAEGANVTLVRDVDGLRAKVSGQNASIAALRRDDADTLRAKDAALAMLASERDSHQSVVDELIARAKTPSASKALACESATKTLDDLAKEQQK
jgi:hypothetical protein